MENTVMLGVGKTTIKAWGENAQKFSTYICLLYLQISTTSEAWEMHVHLGVLS